MLPERTVSLQQLVDHAAEREPVSAGVVGHALGEHLRRHVAVGAHAGVRLFLAEITGEAQVGDAHMAVLVEEDVGGLEIPVDDGARVHVLEAEDYLGGVEFDLVLAEDAVL